MAIDRPGAIEPHPRLKPKGRSAAEGGRLETFLSSARNAVDRGPRAVRGVVRQGKKVARPPLRAEAQPALGQIRPSEVRVARPKRARGNWRQLAARRKMRNAYCAERHALAHQRRRSRLARTLQVHGRLRAEGNGRSAWERTGIDGRGRHQSDDILGDGEQAREWSASSEMASDQAPAVTTIVNAAAVAGTFREDEAFTKRQPRVGLRKQFAAGIA
jgi:hypothetical protein